QQVLLDGQAREQAAALRHQRDAERYDLLGRAACEVVVSQRFRFRGCQSFGSTWTKLQAVPG
ncbi:MAG TPA: hypothetical protein VI756_27200, partial [Blastocatellia bacterium]